VELTIANARLSRVERTWQIPRNEFLFSQSHHCRALVTKNARERVRDAISHSVYALLKANKFLLNLK